MYNVYVYLHQAENYESTTLLLPAKISFSIISKYINFILCVK